MKVLLVEPPKKPWEMMGDFIAPPIGLAQLAAVPETDDCALHDTAYHIISTEHLTRQ